MHVRKCCAAFSAEVAGIPNQMPKFGKYTPFTASIATALFKHFTTVAEKPSATSYKYKWLKTGQMQHTISGIITKSGIGLHSGLKSVVKLMPAMAGEGRYFVINGGEKFRVSASIENVSGTILCTRIGRGTSSVGTVEHLLSALEGMGVDNCRIEIYGGNEVPLLDGSSLEWAEAIEDTGKCIARDISGNPIEKMARVVAEPVHVFNNESFVAAFPAKFPRFTYGIDFPQVPVIGCQWFSWSPIDSITYKRDVAPSRTFAIYEQIEQLRSNGLIKGGSLQNALVCSIERGWMNPPLRFPEEPCRHKLLDLIGDMSLSAQNGHQGLPVAHVVAFKVVEGAQKIGKFIYNHTIVLSLVRRHTGGKDPVRPTPTRFATHFLTLRSLESHRLALMQTFGSSDWTHNEDFLTYRTSNEGIQVVELYSNQFWAKVAEAVKASHALHVSFVGCLLKL